MQDKLLWDCTTSFASQFVYKQSYKSNQNKAVFYSGSLSLMTMSRE